MNKTLLLLTLMGLFIIDSQVNAATHIIAGTATEENNSQCEHTVEDDDIEETKHHFVKVCEESAI